MISKINLFHPQLVTRSTISNISPTCRQLSTHFRQGKIPLKSGTNYSLWRTYPQSFQTSSHFSKVFSGTIFKNKTQIRYCSSAPATFDELQRGEEIFLDVYDAKGRKTEITKNWDQLHKDGDWHMVTQVWIVNKKGEILMQKKKGNHFRFPNLWEISGATHCYDRMSSLENAKVEIFELYGIDLARSQLHFIGESQLQESRPEINYFNNEFIHLYIAEMEVNINDLDTDPHEIAEIKMVPFEEMFAQWESNPEYVKYPLDGSYHYLREVFRARYGQGSTLAMEWVGRDLS